MPHQPFPLADYNMGLSLAKQPFLSPTTAYRKLKNGRVFRGRLEKRAGYSFFGALPSTALTQVGPSTTFTDVDTWIGGDEATGGANPPWFDITSGKWLSFQADTIVFTRTQIDATTIQATLTDLDSVGPGMVSGVVKVMPLGSSDDNIQLGWFRVEEDEFFVDWRLHPDYPGTLDGFGIMEYTGVNGLPVTGIEAYTKDGVNDLLVFDTTTAYLWDDFSQSFTVLDGPGNDPLIFSGDKDDQVWVWPTDQYPVFTNGVDPVYRWVKGNAPSVELMPVDLNPDSIAGLTGTIDRALIVVSYRNRLVYLNVTEDGQSFFRRARWTIAGSSEVFDSDGLGWADAPAEYGNIRTAGFIGERLFVGFDNGWMMLNRTGDSASPFEWLPVTSRFGSGAKMTTIEDGGRLLTRSETTMQAIDPNNQYPIDTDIPDRIVEWNPNQGASSVAKRNEPDREFWWSYVSAQGTEIDAALVAQYDEKGGISWSEYDTNFIAFGEYEVHETLIWNNMPGTWADYANVSWDNQGVTAGFPLFLGGKADGRVYRVGVTSSDFGEDISFLAQTQALSPYPGEFAHLGWLDIYAEASKGTLVEFLFYDKEGGSAYKNITVDFSPKGSSSKIYRRVRVGRSAAFHQITIKQKGSRFFAIDALVPWFRATSMVQDFG